jgi:hypothetical protein
MPAISAKLDLYTIRSKLYLIKTKNMLNQNSKKDSEWDGVGTGLVTLASRKKVKTENANPLITRVKVFNGEKHLNVPISLDWSINCFRLENRLKHFLKEQGISNLLKFKENYEKLQYLCPQKTLVCLENFHKVLLSIISGPPYGKNIYDRIKKNKVGSGRKRPNTVQRAFLNALYFFERIFNKFQEFKRFVYKKSIELGLQINPNYI